MGGGHSAETIKTGEDAHKYFLSTTSRSVVIELHNNTATEWKLQEHAKKLYGRKTDFKIAPHIADILVLSGIAKSVCRALQLRRRKV